MSGPINRLPIGLQSLWDLKHGNYPNQVADFVQSTLELAPFMRAQAFEVFPLAAGTNIISATAVGLNGGITIPTDEYWWVAEYSLTVTLTATQALDAAPAFTTITPSLFPDRLGDFVVGAASQAWLATSTYAFPRVFQPGTLFGVWIRSLTVGLPGSVDMQPHLRIIRLRA